MNFKRCNHWSKTKWCWNKNDEMHHCYTNKLSGIQPSTKQITNSPRILSNIIWNNEENKKKMVPLFCNKILMPLIDDNIHSCSPLIRPSPHHYCLQFPIYNSLSFLLINTHRRWYLFEYSTKCSCYQLAFLIDSKTFQHTCNLCEHI